MDKYVFRNGAKKIKGLTPVVVGRELNRIAKKNGEKLTPTVVVEESRPENAKLHPCFTWEDKLAAEMHRRWEARQLIKVIQVEGETGSTEPQFVHVGEGASHVEGHYRDRKVLLKHTDEYELALAEAKRRLVSAQVAFNSLKDLAVRSKDDRAALIGVVLEALGTAQATVQRIQ